jgi:hypothetical protein
LRFAVADKMAVLDKEIAVPDKRAALGKEIEATTETMGRQMLRRRNKVRGSADSSIRKATTKTKGV